MPRPRFCRNPVCPNASQPPPRWFVRAGTYPTVTHGRVQRYRCRSCGHRVSTQSESIHYYSKRRLDLPEIYSRLRSGSSLRDIGRELGVSRTAIAHAVLRLGRQSMAAHIHTFCTYRSSGRLSFDGLVSAVTSRDYPSQITTLVDTTDELLLSMTHCVTERGGTHTPAQRRRIKAKRKVYRPPRGALAESIGLLLKELPQYNHHHRIHLDTDEHPVYRKLIEADAVLTYLKRLGRFTVRRNPGTAPRTTENPLFMVNYIDRMIRHRMKEHTRETIGIARNSTMQMHRMWIFAWDHNVRQPRRVRGTNSMSRAQTAGVSATVIEGVRQQFYRRRYSMRNVPIPEPITRVWRGDLESPPVRWKAGQKTTGPLIPGYALMDLRLGRIQGQ